MVVPNSPPEGCYIGDLTLYVPGTLLVVVAQPLEQGIVFDPLLPRNALTQAILQSAQDMKSPKLARR
jgi:hypothetical protein